MLEGKFGNNQVDEVLQTVVRSAGTGRLSLDGTSIFGGHIQATFYLENSCVVHVETGAGTRLTSMIDLFCLKEGTFSFASGERSPARDQSVPVADIMLQVTAALDEWNAMRQRLGSLDAVYSLRAGGAVSDFTLTREQWRVMARLDGKTSLRELARVIGASSVAVAKTVYGFVEAGLAAEVEAVSPAVEPDQEVSPRRGFLGLWSRR
ncbi:MAG: DUF4388 domain-containing protein [Candidatus Cryosericum sp.]|nr:DUF4388 domain-containing protein [bacterium]